MAMLLARAFSLAALVLSLSLSLSISLSLSLSLSCCFVRSRRVARLAFRAMDQGGPLAPPRPAPSPGCISAAHGCISAAGLSAPSGRRLAVLESAPGPRGTPPVSKRLSGPMECSDWADGPSGPMCVSWTRLHVRYRVRPMVQVGRWPSEELVP